MKRAPTLLAVALVPALLAAGASAAEITVLCPRGVQHTVTALAEDFQRETGHRLWFSFGTAGGVQARAAGADAADVVIASAAGVGELARRGVVLADRPVTLGRVGVGVAVRAGGPVPDVSTPEALKQAILAARSLAYADPARGGQGGTHFAQVIGRLGIAEAVKPRTRLYPEGLQALEAIARGEHELGAAPVSEIVAMEGLALAGPLPPSLQRVLVYSAGVLARSREPDVARAFLAFLVSPAARERFKADGFEPPE